MSEDELIKETMRLDHSQLVMNNVYCHKEIERLNKKIEQYENPEDMTLMFMWCDEKAKDEIKRLNNIIKEVREYISKVPLKKGTEAYRIGILEILDKENKE